jgi:uncharacterized protein
MKAFQQTQLEFIRHIKEPTLNGFEHGIEDRRLQIYRDLFFNNILGFLSSGFPVLESLYSDEQWRTLARSFFANHECRSPYFVDISKEFVEYLSNDYQLTESDPPFMLELAHYEWVELAASIKKQSQPLRYWDGEEDYGNVALSELATLLSYHYPVHQISYDYLPEKLSEAQYMVVYRDRQDKVTFTLLNAATAYLLNVLEQQPQDLTQLSAILSEAMPQLAPDQVAASVKVTVEQLLTQQILVLLDD